MAKSKSLGHDDSSGFEFAKEMLAGDYTAAINFDRIQKLKGTGEYIIFEYLLCEESQPRVTPYTSHPKYYWNKNKQKFISLWEIASALNAKLYLVNYAKKGTKHEDEVLVMKVSGADESKIVTESKRFTRAQFSEWFRQLNARSL